MSENITLGKGCSCGSSVRNLRRITLLDGSKVGIDGLEALMQAVYEEGRLPEIAIAAETIRPLHENNWIVSYAEPA